MSDPPMIEADDEDASSFATSAVVNLVFDRVLSAVHEGRLLPGQRISDSELAGQLGVSRTPVREALQRLREIGIVEASASRFTRVALVSPKQTADAMIVWVALYSALVNEVMPLVTPELLSEMRDDHALFLGYANRLLDRSTQADLEQNAGLTEQHTAELLPQKIAMANAKFFHHLVTLSANPALVRGITSVVHLVQLGSLYLPEFIDFRALSESQQRLIDAACDHDRSAAQGALRMLGLISVPTAALEAAADSQ
ncbi:GntR family transcriptional regulator [Frigoribacterium sp. CG_9.8]|uniref:GntR family transcriptional regulator n=1 Tax=Frigoribacterium sp. CG_9.8 TaxID=2787733 RepID=UPI0018CA30A6|nr:DNA-binding GntR family transcriptional regulator [Frigoribacterium sp. CG_9.8]